MVNESKILSNQNGTVTFKKVINNIRELLNQDGESNKKKKNSETDLEKIENLLNELKATFHQELQQFYHEDLYLANSPLELSNPKKTNPNPSKKKNNNLKEDLLEKSINGISVSIKSSNPQDIYEAIYHLNHLRQIFNRVVRFKKANKRFSECDKIESRLKNRTQLYIRKGD